MKLTRNVIFNLNDIISEINVPSTFNFNYALKRNKDRFISVLKSMPKYKLPETKEYQKYLDEAEKKIKDGKIKFKTSKEKGDFYRNEIESYEVAKAQIEKAQEDFKKSLEVWQKEEVEIDLYLLQNKDDIPNNLTSEQFECIWDYLLKKEENSEGN